VLSFVCDTLQEIKTAFSPDRELIPKIKRIIELISNPHKNQENTKKNKHVIALCY